MPNKTFSVAAIALLLSTTSACKTLGQNPAASSSDRSNSSWCQGDRLISYEPGEPGEADPMNVLDSAATVTQIMIHNARLRAACPS